MDLNLVIKALGNPMRMQILNWLKAPKQNFPVESQLVDADVDGVCVSIIQEKSGLSQSTISVYLATLQRAGLVNAKRIGPWTYYQRDEQNIKLFLSQLELQL
ncbi:helix-turn-helix transcriptional regulator [Shewanella sp. SR44-3]|uniref:ArsR/SmtB family transcription factor n=1 Tax=unclassified Shewanella TaxID=196818 RepID=UPI0015F873F3|nr:helix-turn-helix transcriptional regulator [Shewanella sp. SR44-3]MBB1268445.1 helix-turn-helix transcriptional regulator [Shewanella sp. SR44-3]